MYHVLIQYFLTCTITIQSTWEAVTIKIVKCTPLLRVLIPQIHSAAVKRVKMVVVAASATSKINIMYTSPKGYLSRGCQVSTGEETVIRNGVGERDERRKSSLS